MEIRSTSNIIILRKLLQDSFPLLQNAPDSANRPRGGNETLLNCKTSLCTAIIVIIIVGVFLTVAVLVGLPLYRRWKYSSAVRSGSVPASMLIPRMATWRGQMGDVAAFTFPVHRPIEKEEIKEDSCPICFKPDPRLSQWISFKCSHGVCNSCFKKLVREQRLHAACPLCRALLAEGEGNRGDQPSPQNGTEAPVPVQEEQPQQQEEQEEEARPPPAAQVGSQL